MPDGTALSANEQYAAYLSLGWQLVPLHDVRSGRCSCGVGEACTSAGKHPRLREWQRPNQLVRNTAMLSAYSRQTNNFGVATGSPSGIWVLDVDPAGAGEFAKWCDDPGDDSWTNTLTAQTGSGGLHLYFALPTDGGPPITNVSKRKRREGVMPPGIDVRGEGGQAVLPPSVSGKGAYAWLNWGAPILSAPAWLLALVREDATEEKPAPIESTDARTGAGASSPGEVSTRGQAYATSAVNGLVAELWHADVGTRNDVAFANACRLHELINASWSGLDEGQVYAAWWDAGKAHPGGKHVPDHELLHVWQSAARKVAGAAAELPETWLQGEAIPFSSAPLAYGSPTGHEGDDSGTRVLSTESVDNTRVPALDEWLASPAASNAVAVEMGRLAVREEARRRLAAATGGTLHERVAKMRATLLDRAGLLALPSPRWLVPDVLQRDSLARIFGQPGHGKSFVALDLAGALGSRLEEWAGRAVEGCDVLYVVGEAVAENGARVRAWEAARGREMTGVAWYPEPVQAGDAAAWDALVVLAGELAPGLIVIDTQARITVGINENDPTDMGRFVEQCERLRAATGACVLLVHHTPVGADRARGTGAVKGAMHTEILCRKDGREIELYLDKQKGAPDGDDGPQDLRFALAPAYASDGSVLAKSDDSGQARTLVDPSEQVGVALHWTGERPREQRDAGRTKDGHKIMVTDDELLGNYVGRAAVIASMVLASPAAEVTKAEFAKMLAEQNAKGSDATWKRTWAELLSRRVIAQIRGTMRYRYIRPEDRAGLTEPRRGERDGAAGFYCE